MIKTWFINAVILFALVTSTFTALASATAKPVEADSSFNRFGADIKVQCQKAVNYLSNIKGFNLLPSFEHTMVQFEQQLIPAQNLLFESYLFANVSPDKQTRLSAEQCQLSLATQIDLTLASKETGALLTYIESFITTPLEQRVFDKYQQQHRELANSDFLKLKRHAKEQAKLFRKTAVSPVNESFDLAQSCTPKLPTKYHKRFVKNGHVNVALVGKNYATLIKRLDDEECRKQAYRQYQGRHKEVNQHNLFAMLSGQNKKAEALKFANFAQYSLQNTSFSSVQQVNSFLSTLAVALPESAAPWNVAFNQNKNNKKHSRSKSQNTSLTPVQAQQGLFTLLSDEFNLHVQRINEQSWHSSVAVYKLSQGGEYLGKFYLDLYSREGKYRKNRHRAIKRGVLSFQKPSSTLILNLPKKNWQQKHIKSFFHEFGHLLHNMLARQKYHIVAGISLENDLIEMPAKWFEWLSFSDVMQHKMFNQVLFKGDKPDAGSKFKMRLYRSALALTYFSEQVNQKNIDQINARLSKQYLGYPFLKGADSQYSFSHLGTYGPRYYSYIWSEKVAQKLLEDFLKHRFSGENFTSALFSQGGSVDIEAMFSLLYKKPVSMADIMQWVNNEKKL